MDVTTAGIMAEARAGNTGDSVRDGFGRPCGSSARIPESRDREVAIALASIAQVLDLAGCRRLPPSHFRIPAKTLYVDFGRRPTQDLDALHPKFPHWRKAGLSALFWARRTSAPWALGGLARKQRATGDQERKDA